MNTLTAVLRDPECAAAFTAKQWEALLGEGRRARMLARVHHLLLAEQSPALHMPLAVRDMLSGHARYVAHMHVLVHSELRQLAQLAVGASYPIILLKGAAYLAAQLPIAPGRGLSDIDLLVPHSALADFERRLHAEGWEFDSALTDYDDRYYRQWSHELPPMRRRASSLELDVHHNLIQPTSRSALDVAPMIARSQEVAGTPFRVLAPSDMVLHSVLHLLMSDELRGGIRDLFDIHSLCRYFTAEQAGFWLDLVARGRELGLMRPLYYALSAAKEIFGLSPPAGAWGAISEARPVYPIDRLMLGLMRWHLAPVAYDARRAAFVEQLLYVRSHWVRMPPYKLVRHLLYKSTLALRGKKDA